VNGRGKDGPNGLFVWAEGLGAPVDQLVDEGGQAPIAQRQRLVLPTEFVIYCYDCPDHSPVEAVCRAVDGVWVATEIRP
jgi:hypothetical protein